MITGDLRMQARLIAMLRAGAVMTGSAFLTLPLQVESMVAVHRWLGLGEMPRAPIVDYLARSVSAFYGFHGVLLFVLSTDVERYSPVIDVVAVSTTLLGLILLAVDIHAGMPPYWTAGEGPVVALIGLVLLSLNRAAARERAAVPRL